MFSLSNEGKNYPPSDPVAFFAIIIFRCFGRVCSRREVFSKLYKLTHSDGVKLLSFNLFKNKI